MAKDKEYRVAITGIYLKNGDFARGRTVVNGDQLIDLDKALDAGYVVLESEAKKADEESVNAEKASTEEAKKPAKATTEAPKKPLTAAQQKKADDDAAKKSLDDAHALYLEKFFSDAPKDSTLEAINSAIEQDKPIEVV